MRKLLFLATLTAVVGCQGGPGLFSGRKKEPAAARCPDPLLSPDVEEQQRWGRSMFSYPDEGRNIAPPTYSDRPTPSGR